MQKKLQNKITRSAFTMIELVFVIVVLGILAAVAIPRLAATRTDAQISKARADISSIRSGIVTERQSRLITGDSSWITAANLDSGNGDYFGGVLTYGISASTGNDGWSKAGNSYIYKVGGVSTTFDYNATTGIFDCNTGTYCSKLTD